VRPNRREAIVSRLKLERYTEHTIVSRPALVEDLRRIRDVGFAICDREEFLQVAGISAPVFGHHGEVVAAISLWNIVEHQGIEELLSFGNDLLSATGTLSARLGLEAARSITN
jgi:DNA-binding IclR family transcriptional regulator